MTQIRQRLNLNLYIRQYDDKIIIIIKYQLRQIQKIEIKFNYKKKYLCVFS